MRGLGFGGFGGLGVWGLRFRMKSHYGEFSKSGSLFGIG